MTAELTGRTAIVTGCASGIGGRTTRRLAELGARVIGVDRPESTIEPDVAPHLAGDLRADLSQPTGPEQVAEQIAGPVHLLVNSAGVAATRPWREVVSVNALAPRDLTRLLLPKFADAAAVVTVASQVGFAWRANFERSRALLAIDDWNEALASLADTPDIQQKCYEISKEAAIVGTLELAIDRSVPGLRANAVSPGTVQTPLLPDFTAAMGTDAIDGAAAWAGRHAQPEEVAEAIAFLGSDRASWINGVDLPVDGGYGAQILTYILSTPVQAV